MKYRIFNKETGKYCDPNEWMVNQEGKACFIYLAETYVTIIPAKAQDDFIIERSTGLVALDGAEIFEGDVVKVKRCHTKSIEKQKGVFGVELIEDGLWIGEILFIFPSFCISFEHLRYDDIENMLNNSDRIEVIGNINQNRELLQ